MAADIVAEYIDPFVRELESKGAFREDWIKQAFLRVPRHMFVDRIPGGGPGMFVPVNRRNPANDHLSLIYSDTALPMGPESENTISQPQIVSDIMLHLKVARGAKVLEVGTGSGFDAALLAHGTFDPKLVHSVDLQARLVEAAGAHLFDAGISGVNLVTGDGGLGWEQRAPFDRIVISAGCPDVAPEWTDQLSEGGILLVPFRTYGAGDPVLRLQRSDESLSGGFVSYASFETLYGKYHDGRRTGLEYISLSGREQNLLRKTPIRTFPFSWESQVDFAVFCNANGAEFEFGRAEVGGRGYWIVVDHSAEIVMARESSSEYATLHADKGQDSMLLKMIDSWHWHGRPGITDYRVEAVASAAPRAGEKEWIDRRGHISLRLSLLR